MRVERLPAVLAFQCGVATRGLMPGIRIRNVCFYCFPNAAMELGMEEWFPTENALRVPRAPSPQLSAFFSVSSLKSSCYTCLLYRSSRTMEYLITVQYLMENSISYGLQRQTFWWCSSEAFKYQFECSTCEWNDSLPSISITETKTETQVFMNFCYFP